MAKRGKKYRKVIDERPKTALSPKEAVEAVKKLSYSSFPGTVEFHLALKLPADKDPKSLKSSISLPHSTSTKSVKIAVFTSESNEAKAKEYGADFYSMKKLTENIKAGKIEFDLAIATPDVMPKIASLGKELGPRGLMPNPKTGTVTEDLEVTISEYKKGKLNFAADEKGVVHFSVGKVDTDTEKVVENIYACLEAAAALIGKRPEQTVKTAYLATSMGPSVKLRFEFEGK